jgi:flagellar M-ring protein FliF
VLQTLLNKFNERGIKLDPRWFLASLAAVAALVAILVVFYLWRDQESLRPLYGSGESFQAAEVMAVLDAESLRYRVHPTSGQILVRDADLARARMLLASKGVKVSMPAGYELFDKEEPLGTSQFVQNVRLKRSLEGELAQTIMTLKGVDSVRVHLAQEENHSFVVGKRAPAKASVMLQLSPGYKMGQEQVHAIVNLVAGSLPQLKPEDVHVVDQYGMLLSRGLNAWGGPTQNWQALDDYQQKMTSNIEQVLAPVLGLGNYRVSVAADIDFSQREETQQIFGETPYLRSEVLRDERTLDQLALGVPGSLSNRPVVEPAEGDDENRAATSTRQESTRRLDYDQTVTHIKYPAFRLRQQSVAVVLNASSAPEGGWSPEARAELETMIRGASGFQAERGDLVTLSVLPFAGPAAVEEPVSWWQQDKVLEWARMGLIAFISLLLLLFVVRPVIRALSPQKDPALEAQALAAPSTPLGVPPSANLPGDDLQLLARETQNSGLPKVFSELNPLSEIRLPAPGSGLEHQIEHLQMLSLNEPERVSEVIKHWIGRNEKKA